MSPWNLISESDKLIIVKTLVIGSSDIDIFVSPEDKDSYVENQKEIIFTLGDKVPINMNAMTLGGNGANVSVGLARLSLDVSFYTFFGEDLLSHQIQDSVKEEKVNLVDHGQHTKSSSISLIFDFEHDRIIFPHHEVLDHKFEASKVPNVESLYLTSLGEKWEDAYKSIHSYVQEHPLALAFSPGSHQLSNINDLIFEIISVSKILFVNKEEGERILEKHGEKAATMQELLQKLSLLGPEIVSVTNAKEGAYAYVNKEYFAVPSFDKKSEGKDKTGAGDSYAAAFFAAYLLGHDIKTSMRWGAVNAQSVMGKVGAQEGLLDVKQIEDMLAGRPDFQVTTL